MCVMPCSEVGSTSGADSYEVYECCEDIRLKCEAPNHAQPLYNMGNLEHFMLAVGAYIMSQLN